MYSLCVLSHLQSCLTLRPYELQPARLLCPWDSPGKNTGLGSHSLPQGIFPTHGLNPDLLHYLVSQLVKNLPAVREAWIQSLGWDDPLEKGFPLQYSGLENSMDYIVHGVAKSRTQLSIFHFHFLIELKADSLLSEPPGKPRKKQTYTSNRQSTRTYSMAQGTLLEIL